MTYMHLVFPLALLGIAVLFQIRLHEKDVRFAKIQSRRKKRES